MVKQVCVPRALSSTQLPLGLLASFFLSLLGVWEGNLESER